MAQKNTGGSKTGGMGTAGIVGLAAAAIAGAYFLYGKEGAKRRTKIKGWMLKAKGEVLDKLETMKDVNEEAYNKVVDTVGEKYKKVKGIELGEIAELTTDLKRHWSNIKRQMNANSRPAAKKKTSKPAAKKANRTGNGNGSSSKPSNSKQHEAKVKAAHMRLL